MKEDINWENYYNGYSPVERDEVPEDSILHYKDIYWKNDRDENDLVDYYGPRTNATVKQIIYDMGACQRNEKFLYNGDTVIILLDYSKKMTDKWKNGTVLYCHGERQYSIPGQMNNLSVIDKMLFGAGSDGEIRVYAFWKDTEENYRFIYGILVLNNDPYQIKENGKYRWVFPLALTSNKFFSMSEKYSFNVEIDRVDKKAIREKEICEEQKNIAFNAQFQFDFSEPKPKYKGCPQKKEVVVKDIREANERKKRTSLNALRIADFKCEYDAEHPTFIRKKSNIPYTEAHHLVPLSCAELFKNSLDVEENIVSLCSTCHNQIHYGKDAENIIKKLFADRKELLKKAGIIISEQELLKLYDLCESDD